MNIGQVAPHFSLFDTNRSLVNLSDKIVGDDLSFYQKLGAEVIGISVDSPFALKRFKEDKNLQYTLLSDFNKGVIRAYDVYREDFVCDMHGVAERAVIVIGSNGTIQYREVLENAGHLPDFEALKRALETID